MTTKSPPSVIDWIFYLLTDGLLWFMVVISFTQPDFKGDWLERTAFIVFSLIGTFMTVSEFRR